MMNPMKDSGVEWIGQIPNDWSISRMRFLGNVKNGLTYSPDDLSDETGTLVLRSSNIQDGRLSFNDNVYVSKKVNSDLMMREKDILITSRNGSPHLIGKNVIIENDIIATYGAFMMVYRPNKKIIPKFSYYLMNSSFDFYRTFFSTSTINQLTAGIFNNIEVVCPPLQEQQVIANFLDEETKKLDDAKDILQQQIEKLKEYRKSLIYETVTKGLDNTVLMKDSGVDWLGEIPEEWKLTRLKYLTRITTGTSDSQDQVIDAEFPFYIRSQKPVNIDYFTHDCTAILTAGDGDIGNIWHYVNGKFTAHQRVYIISDFIGDINSRYLYFYFSEVFKLQPVLFDAKTTVGSLRMSMLTNFEVLLPQIEDQQAIADFLDAKTDIIEKVLFNIQSQIEVIDKQKKTLIYDYVTGKRRVEQ